VSSQVTQVDDQFAKGGVREFALAIRQMNRFVQDRVSRPATIDHGKNNTATVSQRFAPKSGKRTPKIIGLARFSLQLGGLEPRQRLTVANHHIRTNQLLQKRTHMVHQLRLNAGNAQLTVWDDGPGIQGGDKWDGPGIIGMLE